MKIRAITLGMLRVPLRTPFRTALREVDAIADVIVRIDTDDGRCGYGSAPATARITGDTHASIIEAVSAYITPPLLGASLDSDDELAGLCDRVQRALAHNSNAKAAVEIALYDLWAQQREQPLYAALGGGTPTLRTDLTISLNPPQQMVDDALAALARGFDALKVKLGGTAEEDIVRVRAIHAAVAGRACLRLDANQAWDVERVLRIMSTLEDGGILPDLLEQPLPATDLAGMCVLRRGIRTPLLADESVFTADDARRVLDAGAADIISIKLMKSAGIRDALRIVDLAHAAGATCMISCMLESSIGVAAAAHLAVARSATINRVDLDAAVLGEFDPVDGNVRFDDAAIDIAAAPGLGIRHVDGLVMLPE